MASRRSRERPNKRRLEWDEVPRTGWEGHMLQDESIDLSKWLASKPDAMQHAREAAMQITADRSTGAKP